MTEARLEVFVEPFVENSPGPHVLAVLDAATAAGLDVDMGPFATVATGDVDTVIAAAQTMLAASFDAGATSIQLSIESS